MRSSDRKKRTVILAQRLRRCRGRCSPFFTASLEDGPQAQAAILRDAAKRPLLRMTGRLGTIHGGRVMARNLPPLPPGKILGKEFLLRLRMSAGALARVCGGPRRRIERLANGKTGVTADTALRLSK